MQSQDVPPTIPQATSGRRVPMAAAILGCLLVVGAVIAWLAWPRPPLSGEMSHDFGTVVFERGPHWSEHTFELTNVSSLPVRVLRSVSSCGCTQALTPDTVIEPGAVLDVPVKLRLLDSGRRSSKVTLLLADGRRVPLHVTAVGSATESLRVTPDRLMLRPPRGMGLLTLKAQGPTMPTDPVMDVPDGVTVEFQGWGKDKPADESLSRPASWEALVVVNVEGSGPKIGSELHIKVEGSGSLDVPLGPPVKPTMPDPQEGIEPESPAASPPGDH